MSTKAIPTDGETPRASLMAQMMVLDSLCPKADGVAVVLLLLPEAVPERVVKVDVGCCVLLVRDVFVTDGDSMRLETEALSVVGLGTSASSWSGLLISSSDCR